MRCGPQPIELLLMVKRLSSIIWQHTLINTNSFKYYKALVPLKYFPKATSILIFFQGNEKHSEILQIDTSIELVA
jgi:hypothetical protein